MSEQETPNTSGERPTLPPPRDQSVLSEIWQFLRIRKKFWLAPIILALLLLGMLFFLAGQAGVVAPFLYAL